MNRLIPVIVLLLTAGPSFAVKQYEVRQADVERLGESMQREIEALQYVLNAHQTRQFFQLRDDTARGEWLERYWKSKDPTPTTEENEMQIEHMVRSRLARQLFKSKRWPGWDKRGEVFIRYGAPNLRSKIHAEVTARKTHPPGELWYYGRHGMMVIFRDESLSGHYVYAINALGAVQDISPELAEFLIYDADVSVESIIPEEALQFYRNPEIDPDSVDPNWDIWDVWERGLPTPRSVRPRVDRTSESWDEIMDPDRERLLPPEGPASIFMVDKAEKLANEFEATLEDTPSAYPFNFKREEFPFFYGIDQFKGGDGVNRVEVNIELPIDPTTEEEAGATRQFTVTAVFWDANFTEIERRDQQVVVPVVEAGAEEKLWPVQLLFTLKEDYYRMAVTVSELRAMLTVSDDSTRSVEGSKRESSYRSTVASRSFGKDLALSDILFAQRIGKAEKPSPFTRGAIEVVPHPYRRYRQGVPLPLYFEVYNLSVDEDGLCRYDVEYKIIPHSPAKRQFWDRFANDVPAASSRFSGSGYGRDENIYVSVLTENLTPGTYDLLVTVEDDQSRELSYRQTTFRIVESAP